MCRALCPSPPVWPLLFGCVAPERRWRRRRVSVGYAGRSQRQNMQSTTEPLTPQEEVLFEGRPALIPSVGVLLLVIVTLGLWLLPRWWRSLAIHYRITSRRIVVETGVLSKRMEQIDLYRVNDY